VSPNSLTVYFVRLQVFLVVFQMKHGATQALVSRVSIAAVFAQSLLDANLCMVHLLLCFAFPNIFFGSFIWIAALELLLFSVFQMRMIINIYQAR
jgi:antibiotic biosynthesis monooxygenase (ABM) superfamily enzyme